MTVADRIKRILASVGLDPSLHVIFTGNVTVTETKYDPETEFGQLTS